MVLYPLPSREPSSGEPVSCQPSLTPARAVPAWEAVERKQKQAASEWWLVAQPDHAALAGDLAERIDCPEELRPEKAVRSSTVIETPSTST